MRKLVTATALALVAALGLWLALGGTASASNHAPRSHDGTVVVHRAAPSQSTEGQSETGSESSGDSSSTGETDTHEDPNAQDANHECPPNCDTANGEQP